MVNTVCNVSIGSRRGVVGQGLWCKFPGLLTLPDGALLAAYTCSTATIVTKISTDQGRTWMPAGDIHFPATADAMAMLPNGKIFLSTSQAGAGYPTYILGTIEAGDQITWESPVRVATPGWSKGCWAVSPVVKLADGTLLWPVWCYSNTTGKLPGTSTVLLSSDGGKSWPTQVVVAGPDKYGIDFDESAAAVYPNGDVIMILRQTTEDPHGSWWRSKSSNNGKTWSAPVMVLHPSVVGRPTLTLLPSGGLVLLGRARRSGSASTSFATSWDEGLHFSLLAPLGIDGSGPGDQYDAMSLLSNGSIAVVSVHSEPDAGTNVIDYRNLIDRCVSADVK